MSIYIEVKRGLGDSFGGEITDPLLTSLDVALSRGRIECDKAALYRSASLRIVFRPGLNRGQLVEVQDPYQDNKWRGIIMSFSLVRENGSIFADLVIKRPI